MQVTLKPGEKLEELVHGRLWIIQPEKGYRFSLDAVLLASFVDPKPGNLVIDLGTGSAVIPLLIFPRAFEVRVTGIEIQDSLADRARRSIAYNLLEDKITIVREDFRKLGEEWFGQWDMVVANPPFFAAQAGKINPDTEKAIARHEVMCCLEDVINTAGRLLRKKGKLAIVHRPERLEELLEHLRQFNFSLTRLAFVHSNAGREASFFLLEACLGGGAALQILPPVLICEGQGEYTPQMKRVFGGGRLYDSVDN